MDFSNYDDIGLDVFITQANREKARRKEKAEKLKREQALPEDVIAKLADKQRELSEHKIPEFPVQLQISILPECNTCIGPGSVCFSFQFYFLGLHKIGRYELERLEDEEIKEAMPPEVLDSIQSFVKSRTSLQKQINKVAKQYKMQKHEVANKIREWRKPAKPTYNEIEIEDATTGDLV